MSNTERTIQSGDLTQEEFEAEAVRDYREAEAAHLREMREASPATQTRAQKRAAKRAWRLTPQGQRHMAAQAEARAARNENIAALPAVEQDVLNKVGG